MPALTREIVDAAAEELGRDGWQYTPRQLYYASCSAAETPLASSRSAASGVIGLGALIVLLGLIFIGNRYAFVILVALGALLVIAGSMLRLRRDPPAGRVLAMSYADFLRRFCAQPRSGLIDVEGWHQPAWLSSGSVRAIVCDSAETAALVSANAALAGLSDIALDVDALPEQLPWTEVVALHDVSPAGCRMPRELSERGVARVIDAGLRPHAVMNSDLQFIDGATARVSDAARDALSESEGLWLQSGRRLELAVFTPATVLALVTDALSRGPAGSREGAVVATNQKS